MDTNPRDFGSLEIIPFRPGRRPIDEAREPGTGCSEPLGFVSSTMGRSQDDALWVLFRLGHGLAGGDEPVDVRLSAFFLGPNGGAGSPVPVPGLTDVPVPPQRVTAAHYPRPALESTRFEPGSATVYAAPIVPQRDLMGSHAPFGLDNLFHQRVKVEFSVHAGGRVRAHRTTEVAVFDVERFGSLYRRLITQLVEVDARRQAAVSGARRIYEAYHPWYPVLAIGLAKAQSYMRAVLDDLSWQRRNLADPGWLLRVGLYLELLTCFGIIEAVKDEYPDVLTLPERDCFARSPAFAEIRSRIDPSAWRAVWGQRTILFADNPLTAAGPVDLRNLIQKQGAILHFLHVHHHDLRHAIELAGPNLDSAQETWHRVYRDAERAVLDCSQAVFPEMRHLRCSYQHFVLWHEQGEFSIAGIEMPRSQLLAAFGDQDGVYPTAARRYRESMNEVAAWAQERGLMHYAGEECVPPSASLIEARLAGDQSRFAALQAADGYGRPPEPTAGDAEIVAGLLRAIDMFTAVPDSKLWELAQRAERRAYRPGEPVVLQGELGSSLYLVERGVLGVTAVQKDGAELTIARLEPGSLFGEWSMLTEQPASATVRALDDVEVHVISKAALAPIFAARPRMLLDLSNLTTDRHTDLQQKSDRYLFGPTDTGRMRILGRLAGLVLGAWSSRDVDVANAPQIRRTARFTRQWRSHSALQPQGLSNEVLTRGATAR